MLLNTLGSSSYFARCQLTLFAFAKSDRLAFGLMLLFWTPTNAAARDFEGWQGLGEFRVGLQQASSENTFEFPKKFMARSPQIQSQLAFQWRNWLGLEAKIGAGYQTYQSSIDDRTLTLASWHGEWPILFNLCWSDSDCVSPFVGFGYESLGTVENLSWPSNISMIPMGVKTQLGILGTQWTLQGALTAWNNSKLNRYSRSSWSLQMDYTLSEPMARFPQYVGWRLQSQYRSWQESDENKSLTDSAIYLCTGIRF